MDSYSPRIVDQELDELMKQLPAIAIEGPKGVGKTATAGRRATTTYHLDDPAQRAVIAADPSGPLSAEPPVLFDEWQLVPSVWDAVRRAVDRASPSVRYLLAGSAAPATVPTHSGAGRIVRMRMRPLALSERNLTTPTVSMRELLSGRRGKIGGESDVTLADYATEIVASGLPGVRGLTGRARRAQLDGYVARIVDRDFHEQGHVVRKPATLRRWLAAYAAATSTTTSFEKIRLAAEGEKGAGPTTVTVLGYREVLERLWLLDPVPGWTPSNNSLARLTQAPKHHLADPALAARLMGIDEDALMHGKTPGPQAPRDGVLCGRLFESLVTLSARTYAQAAEASLHHLRTREGRHEVDLIVLREDQRVLAMEVKLSSTVTDDDVQHLHWLREQIKDDLLDSVIITTGSAAFRRTDGIAVVPAALLGP